MSELTIITPASSANIGPGFDSLGIALNRYLTIHVERQETWEFEHCSPLLPENDHYKDHLIYKVAKQTASRYGVALPACKVTMDSEIPLARGLGSSASAVMAGIELANQLCELSLTTTEKLTCGADIEGHPDNIAPALLGGLVISVQTKDKGIDYIQLPTLNVDLVAYIPDFELKTAASREVLPSSYSRERATFGSGVSNLMVAALITEDYELAGEMMERDVFHEPFRAELIPHYHAIKETARTNGAYGTIISGAGPVMISFVPEQKTDNVMKKMKKVLPTYEVTQLQIDNRGLQTT